LEAQYQTKLKDFKN